MRDFEEVDMMEKPSGMKTVVASKIPRSSPNLINSTSYPSVKKKLDFSAKSNLP